MSAKFKYTDNKTVFEMITAGLTKAKESLGEYCCSCKLDKTEENICPCVEYRTTAKFRCTLFTE